MAKFRTNWQNFLDGEVSPRSSARSDAEQYFRAHKGIEYDIEVETDVRSVKECAKSILDQFGQSN